MTRSGERDGTESSRPVRRGTRSIPVLSHLSGARRGTTQRLAGDSLRIGGAPGMEIRVAEEPVVAAHHATLARQGETYHLQVAPELEVWVNGERTSDRALVTGDLLEVGRDGPILRYRIYPPGTRIAKTMAEAFSDSMVAARRASQAPVGRAALALSGTVRELATQTSLWFRVLLVLTALLLLAIALLTHRSLLLEEKLALGVSRTEGLAELVAAAGELDSAIDEEEDLQELLALRAELARAVDRLRSLEERSDAPARIFAEASRSVVFLQAAYGFVDRETGLPLKFLALDARGRPVAGPDGKPLVGLGGDGPPLEALVTGTAFVASGGGLLLTNRHVALPWEYDPAANVVLAAGFLPVRHRFVGYLPGERAPLEVRLVGTSESSDLAVLRAVGGAATAPPLRLARLPPEPGDEILVLGYPAGMRALMARVAEELATELMDDPETDFWSLARRLAEAGQVAPLASRGIVAQISSSAVVYDAETTSGGSGGPVLDLEGRVAAITSAVVPDFGGSNLGVPATRARDLLLAARMALWRPVPFH